MKISDRQLREAVLRFTKAQYKCMALSCKDDISQEELRQLSDRHGELVAARAEIMRLGTELLHL